MDNLKTIKPIRSTRETICKPLRLAILSDAPIAGDMLLEYDIAKELKITPVPIRDILKPLKDGIRLIAIRKQPVSARQYSGANFKSKAKSEVDSATEEIL